MLHENQSEKAIVREWLEGVGAGDFFDGDNLIQKGILDSLQTMELIAFLEKEFFIEIMPQDISEKNLATLERIVTLVKRLKG